MVKGILHCMVHRGVKAGGVQVSWEGPSTDTCCKVVYNRNMDGGKSCCVCKHTKASGSRAYAPFPYKSAKGESCGAKRCLFT